AAGIPLGEEFQINTYTTGFQRSPKVSMHPQGSFVVVWDSVGLSNGPGQDGDSSGVFAQRYDSQGQPVGGELQVNTYTTGSQAAPDVAMGQAGDFVVVWSSRIQYGTGPSIYARLFTLSGFVGPEFLVSANTSVIEGLPHVASDHAFPGGFIVSWYEFG